MVRACRKGNRCRCLNRCCVASRLRKSFGTVEVLHGVDIAVRRGERHAIVGENGAGKSTLMRILCGVIPASDGAVFVEGQPLARGLAAARDAGIALVHQELSQVPDLSIAENVVLGSHPTRGGFLDRRAMKRRAHVALDLVGLDRDPAVLIRDLPFGERQLIEIGSALARDPRLLVLDEPTSALSPVEVNRLFSVLETLQDMTVLYVSHRLPEIYRLCEQATVLRDGTAIGTFSLADTTSDELVKAMVGRQIDLLHRRQPITAEQLGPVVIDLVDVHGPRVNGVSLTVRAGEVVGIGGLVGAGRTDTLNLLTGNARVTSGSIALQGKSFNPKSPYAAWRAGIGYVTEDRAGTGLATDLDVSANASAPSIRPLSARGWINRRKQRQLVDEVVSRSHVVPPRPELRAGALSGGNQQKLVLGKWLPTSPRLFVLDEPTKGVDVEAKSEIHRRIDALAHQGAAVLVVSSDLPELLTLSDRILVMRDGRVCGELSTDHWDEASVIAMATASSHVGTNDSNRDVAAATTDEPREM